MELPNKTKRRFYLQYAILVGCASSRSSRYADPERFDPIGGEVKFLVGWYDQIRAVELPGVCSASVARKILSAGGVARPRAAHGDVRQGDPDQDRHPDNRRKLKFVQVSVFRKRISSFP